MSATPEFPSERLPTGNVLLDSLNNDDFRRITPWLEPHSLSMREPLLEAGELPNYAYFPTSGVVSVLTVLENGLMIEFATVGREGTTGVPMFLGFSYSSTALISQIPGECLRISSERFARAVLELPTFRAMLLRYSGLMLTLVAQSAACNRAHHIEARCARWLLMTHDQARADSFPITQEFLSQMLGASRTSVSLAAGALQRDGLIDYIRGQMTIEDRAGLEAASCECYGVLQKAFRHFEATAQGV